MKVLLVLALVCVAQVLASPMKKEAKQTSLSIEKVEDKKEHDHGDMIKEVASFIETLLENEAKQKKHQESRDSDSGSGSGKRSYGSRSGSNGSGSGKRKKHQESRDSDSGSGSGKRSYGSRSGSSDSGSGDSGLRGYFQQVIDKNYNRNVKNEQEQKEAKAQEDDKRALMKKLVKELEGILAK